MHARGTETLLAKLAARTAQNHHAQRRRHEAHHDPVGAQLCFEAIGERGREQAVAQEQGLGGAASTAR